MYRQFFALSVLAVLVLASGCTTSTINAPTTTQPTTGSLNLSSTPQGAEIYLNTVYRGTTPSTIPDLPDGLYHVELRLRDHTAWNGDVEVQAGNTSRVDATLVPIATPTTIPTTVPTTAPPKTVVGCWKAEAHGEDSVSTYVLQFQPGNVGMLYVTVTFPTESKAVSMSFRWFYDPGSTAITVQSEKGGPQEFYHDENNDILIGKGDRDQVFVRVPCEGNIG